MTIAEAIKVLEMFKDSEGKVSLDVVKNILEMVGENRSATIWKENEKMLPMDKSIHEHVGDLREHDEYQTYINPNISKRETTEVNRAPFRKGTLYPKDAYGGDVFYC